MVTQLRMYAIKPGEMDAWVREWKAGVVPLRRKHGFSIPAAWVLEGADRFVWILSYDGPEAWDAKEEAYYASQEREHLDPDPAKRIAKAEKWFVAPVLP